MNEFCTCGARLPEAARFCHKCGKPQFDYPEIGSESEPAAPVVETVAPPPAAGASVPPVGISMRNPVAVRTAFIAGSAAALLLMMPLPPLIHVLWQLVMLVAGGFVAVWLYQRRTGTHLNVRSGAHLGWIAGIFCFAIMMVMFTISIAGLAADGGLQQTFREMLSQRGSPEVAEQMDQLLSSPAGLGVLLGLMVMITFFTLTLLATAGGALGAKILEKE